MRHGDAGEADQLGLRQPDHLGQRNRIRACSETYAAIAFAGGQAVAHQHRHDMRSMVLRCAGSVG